jgi:hypothetical protein
MAQRMSHLFSILNRKARKPSFLKVLAVSRVFEKREGRLSMQQKKRYLFAISLVTAALFVLGVISWSNPQNRGIKAASSDYSITFDKATNKIGTDKFVSPSTVYSGSGFATTGLGNKIGFAYSSFANPTTVWQLIKGGGYFTNTDPISGMKSITLTKSNSSSGFQVYWSETTAFTETNSATYDTTSALTFTCDFSGYAPNYIKVLALGTGNRRHHQRVDPLLVRQPISDIDPCPKHRLCRHRQRRGHPQDRIQRHFNGHPELGLQIRRLVPRNRIALNRYLIHLCHANLRE